MGRNPQRKVIFMGFLLLVFGRLQGSGSGRRTPKVGGIGRMGLKVKGKWDDMRSLMGKCLENGDLLADFWSVKGHLEWFYHKCHQSGGVGIFKNSDLVPYDYLQWSVKSHPMLAGLSGYCGYFEDTKCTPMHFCSDAFRFPRKRKMSIFQYPAGNDHISHRRKRQNMSWLGWDMWSNFPGQEG